MSDSEDNLPDAKECDRRCSEFAEITGTDSALAMFYLQDREWDLQRSIEDYFADSGAVTSKTLPEKSSKDVSKPADDPEPHRIRLMSWNIDGLDTVNLRSRTDEVAKVISKEKPDVAFLQEVVPSTYEQLEGKCSQYIFIPGGTQGYFTCMMIHKSSVSLEDHTLMPFFSSKMGRNLLTVKARVKGVKCWLMTSHLESTKSSAGERKRQLRSAFSEMGKAPDDVTVLFGGDLNLRDQELASIGGVPADVRDLWEITGKRPEARYTWDPSRNDNLDIPFKNARARFDRIYMRCSSSLKAVYFELIGLERVPSCRRFPSDHWGLLAHFNKQ